MFFYFGIFAAGCTLGAYGMNIVTEFLTREKKKRITNETRHFKHDYVGYYSQEMSDGVIEMWARPTGQDWYSGEHLTERIYSHGREPIFLGTFEKDELNKPENFYEFAMPIQRGAIRLYQELGIYVKPK